MQRYLISLFLLLIPAFSCAGEADILQVDASKSADGSYAFAVTLRHADEGWDHYADGWEILAPDGALLATRTLHHPHVHEQPFTRSLAGVELPAGVTSITIRGHDSVHGYGGKTVTLPVP